MTRLLTFCLLPIFFIACSDSDNEKKTQKKASQPAPPTVFEKGLAEFTGGHTKIVWSQYQNPDKIDKQGTSRHHHLMAIDSADGRGEFKVLEERANYAYPIISPDGKRIVFTRKVKIDKGGKRKFDTEIEIVNFDGSGQKKLGKGYAQEIWEDPETGKYWIYAGDEFRYHNGTAPICKRIIRFPLDDPSKREIVWDKTEIGTDSFAISADGKRFAGLFPWPDGGMGDLENNDWEKLDSGCWVSMAPDNSYDMWIFDGPHENLFMFNASGEKTATIQVNTHPAMKKDETYHPRWGNNRNFFVITGPHSSGKQKNRGKPVEVFLGKFSPELDRVESWFQVTKNSLPDIYPDVWIEPNGGNSLIAKTAASTAPIAKKGKWPSNPEGLVFKWETIKTKNEFTAPDGSNQVSRLEPKGFSHYGPNYEMRITRGSFVPALDSEAFLPTKGGFSFQGLVTAQSDSGSVFSFGSTTLYFDGGQLSLLAGLQFVENFAPIGVKEPVHIAMNAHGGKIEIFVNGVEISGLVSDVFSGNSKAEKLSFGQAFDGTLEHIAFYNRPLKKEEIVADHASIRDELQKRKPIERRKVKGKLVFMSQLPDVDSIKPYVRALVDYVYEVDGEKIAVAHWAILDSTPIPSFPRELGKTYDLTIEPKDAHPQLTSQAESSDDEQIDFSVPLFYDVAAPQR